MELATQMRMRFLQPRQDLNRHRLTEIDALNGYISRRGADFVSLVPVITHCSR